MNPLLSALLIFLAFALYAALHSLLASLPAKALARRLFPSADRYYRLAFNIFGTLTLLPVLTLPALLPDRHFYTLRTPWTFIFLAIQALAGILVLLAVKQTGSLSFLGLRQLMGLEEQDDNLTTSGLYKHVRHPIYTFGILFLWFTPIMTLNLAVLYLSMTLYFYIGALFEESKLIRYFGDQYLDFKARTPMLIPRLFSKS